MSTGIQWTDETWNPTVGCSKVSDGCTNCFAERMAVRLAANPKTADLYSLVADPVTKRWTGYVVANQARYSAPMHWKRPRRIFVNSMSDLFHPDVSIDTLDAILSMIHACPEHVFQVLTKRPERMLDYVKHNPPISPLSLPNLWLGVSCEDQATADTRIPILLETPAAVRFVSCEPLLEDICIPCPFDDPAPNWVIVGCESGPQRRPCELAWVESIVAQCDAASVPVFVKQVDLDGRVSKDPAEWPAHLRRREFPA